MIDALSPIPGLITDSVVTEVEVFGTRGCLNGLRLLQLAALGYTVRPLSGTFVLSLPETRSVFCKSSASATGDDDSCHGCSMLKNDPLVQNIVTKEIVRVEKAAMMWHKKDFA